jgi:hypothetical protein
MIPQLLISHLSVFLHRNGGAVNPQTSARDGSAHHGQPRRLRPGRSFVLHVQANVLNLAGELTSYHLGGGLALYALL